MQFVSGMGGTSSDIPTSGQVDSSGNSYVAGLFQGTADFDPGAGTTNLTSAGANDIFIAKYDSSGALVWAKGVGGTSNDSNAALQIDSSGNSYVTGSFRDTADFDPDAGTANLTSAGSYDSFIAKYDSSGALVWAKGVGGTGTDIGNAIQVDSSGNSYVTGYFSGTADFDPGAGTTNLTSAGGNDTFIAKYDSSGALVWAKGIGGTSSDIAASMQIDSGGNSYLIGTFQGTADFDPGAGTTNLTSAGGNDVFIAKYDSTGALVWAKNVGGTSSDTGSSIAVDSNGNSYVAGTFEGTADFDPGAGTTNLTSAGDTDLFIAKYDSTGALVWAKNAGGTDTDQAASVTVDSSGNSYVTGIFTGTADFDPGAGTTNLTSAGETDAYIAKYDSSGALVWAKNVGGTGFDRAASITIDSSGNSHVTGNFTGTADFDPGAGTKNLTSAGDNDIYLLKLDSSGNFVTVASGSGSTGSSGGSSSGSSLTVTGQTTDDLSGTATGRTLVNNTGSSATGTLVQNTGSGNTVTATLPAGVSLTNSGTATAEASSTAGTTLTNQIQAAEPAVGAQSFLDGHGQAFLARSTGISMDVRSISFTDTGTSAQTVQITGAAGSSSGSEAFVIDTTGLPSGSTLQLDNIEFAAIIGNATVTGGAGQNYAVGDDAVQFISLGAEDDTLAGGGGNDTVGSGFGEDIVYGNQGADSVFGGGGMDTLYGGQGADTVLGNNDNDVVYGNKGNDTLWGGENDDMLFGGQNDDIVYGNTGHDSLNGNLGNDTLYGGQGNDLLSGDSGDDVLMGNMGDDTLAGGEGADTFVFTFDGGNDTVADFQAGTDRLILDNGLEISSATETGGNTAATFSDGGSVTLTGISKIELSAATGWELG